MNYFTLLYYIFIIISIFHAWLVTKRYHSILASYIYNGNIEWNQNIDRFKLLLTLTFFGVPLFLLKKFTDSNSSNEIFNNIYITILLFISLFLMWITEKKMVTLKPLTKLIQKTKPFKSFFKSYEVYKILFELLNEHKFYPNNRKLNPIEVNILILKLEKLNLFKYDFIQKELVASVQEEFGIYYGIDNYSRLKKRFEKELFSKIDDDRLNNLKYLDILKNI